MDIQSIIREIENLSLSQQVELNSILTERLKKRERLIKSLDEIRGIGKGLWNMDAQEYINKMRADDRF